MRVTTADMGDKVRYYGIDVESRVWASFDLSKKLNDVMTPEWIREYVHDVLRREIALTKRIPCITLRLT